MAKVPNKVIYGNRTIIDMTDATATPSDLLIGKTAYVSDGTKTSGTLDLKTLQDRIGYPGVFPEASKASSGVVRRVQDRIGYPGIYIAEESETSS